MWVEGLGGFPDGFLAGVSGYALGWLLDEAPRERSCSHGFGFRCSGFGDVWGVTTAYVFKVGA